MDEKAFFAHPTAIVDPGAQIGQGTKIWHFAHVSAGARIGERCIFGQNTFVADDVTIGSNVKVQNNVAIYAGTTVEDDVFLGPSCVLTNVTNPRSQVLRHSLYEPTVIRRGASVGANATIVCGVTLGRYCFVAAGAVVPKDVPDYALMAGVPARQVAWFSRHGHKLAHPGPDGCYVCPESGYRYREVAPGVLRCLDLDEEQPLPAALSQGKVAYDAFKAQPAVVTAPPAEPPVTSVPLLDLKAQWRGLEAEVVPALLQVLESAQFINGPAVKQLEAAVAEYSGCAAAVGVASGTDALLCSLMTLGIGPGDEVLTTPYTFFATAGCIARTGARPVFVDIEADTYNLDPALLERAVTSRTKAIIPVHLFGQVAEMDPILEFAARHDLFVIEDAAQSIGARYKGRPAGSLGTVGCLSFFPSKNLGGFGDGGMIVTQDPELARKLAIFRSHGSSPKYYHKWIGGNFRLDTLQAAGLLVKLPHLEGWSAQRRANAQVYDELLADLPEVVRPVIREYNTSIFNQYVIRVPARDALRDHLKQRGIGNEIYYPKSLHEQECFQYLGYRTGDFPVSEQAASTSLALPIYPELTRRQQEYVAAAIHEFFARG